MKSKSISAAILIIVMLLSALASCSSQTGGTATESSKEPVTDDPTIAADTITVTDDAKHEVTLTLPIERVALLDTGPGTALAALGKLDTVVGTHQALQNSLYGASANVPMVATYAEINYEALAETGPQLVLSATSHHGYVSESDHLDDFGIQFIALDLRTPSRMRDDFRLLGKVFQAEAEAQRVIEFYDKYQNLIDERLANVPEEERPTVFFEMHAGAFHTGSPESQFYQQVELAGGRNIAFDLADNPSADDTEVSAEWVAEKNPDYVLIESTALGTGYDSDSDAALFYDDFKARPGLAGVTAVKEDNIIMMGIDILSRPGYIVGVCYLAKEFYPELFADLDPAEVHREWYDIAFNGTNVEGIWTYTK
ncbi:MAG: ABC transporter substrate-binding protein [Clostridiales Family XIII bacterium]|jgi:iron complex transport system substrate-binding protein|nr:ABC transporter substrate-binding protein [Clostridiales Family XIII bacterium]